MTILTLNFPLFIFSALYLQVSLSIWLIGLPNCYESVKGSLSFVGAFAETTPSNVGNDPALGRILSAKAAAYRVGWLAPLPLSRC